MPKIPGTRSTLPDELARQQEILQADRARQRAKDQSNLVDRENDIGLGLSIAAIVVGAVQGIGGAVSGTAQAGAQAGTQAAAQAGTQAAAQAGTQTATQAATQTATVTAQALSAAAQVGGQVAARQGEGELGLGLQGAGLLAGAASNVNPTGGSGRVDPTTAQAAQNIGAIAGEAPPPVPPALPPALPPTTPQVRPAGLGPSTITPDVGSPRDALLSRGGPVNALKTIGGGLETASEALLRDRGLLLRKSLGAAGQIIPFALGGDDDPEARKRALAISAALRGASVAGDAGAQFGGLLQRQRDVQAANAGLQPDAPGPFTQSPEEREIVEAEPRIQQAIGESGGVRFPSTVVSRDPTGERLTPETEEGIRIFEAIKQPGVVGAKKLGVPGSKTPGLAELLAEQRRQKIMPLTPDFPRFFSSLAPLVFSLTGRTRNEAPFRFNA